MAFTNPVQVATNSGTSGTASATLGTPATLNNIIVLVVGATRNGTFSTPTGFTAGTTLVATTGRMGQMFYKVAAGGETAVSSTLDSSANWVASLEEWSGNDTVTPTIGNGAQANASGSTPPLPSVTPTASKTALGFAAVFTLAGSSSAEQITGTNAGSVTEQQDTAGTSCSLATWTAPITSTSGSYGGQATTSSSQTSVTMLLILNAGPTPISATITQSPVVTFLRTILRVIPTITQSSVVSFLRRVNRNATITQPSVVSFSFLRLFNRTATITESSVVSFIRRISRGPVIITQPTVVTATLQFQPIIRPVQRLEVQAQTLLSGAVLAEPSVFPSPAPLRLETYAVTLLKTSVRSEPGSS